MKDTCKIYSTMDEFYDNEEELKALMDALMSGNSDINHETIVRLALMASDKIEAMDDAFKTIIDEMQK